MSEFTFKDAVAADTHSVFLNMKEFADVHEIDGERIKCIIDKDLTKELSTTIHNSIEGVFLNALTIYVASDALPYRPVEGEALSVDGSLHLVRNVSDEDGVLVIVAEANEQ